MITREQIEKEVRAAIEESEEMNEIGGVLRGMSNALQRLKGTPSGSPAAPAETEPAATEPEEKTGGQLEKDTPVSIMKKQKDVVVGQGGQKETPLVMQIQKMGLSQSTAQAIAKRVGEYLKQRKIPIAEVLQKLEALYEQEISLPSQDSKEDKERASQIRQRFGTDFKETRGRIAQLEKELEAKQKSSDPFKDQAIRMIQQDLAKEKEKLEDYEKQLGDLKTSAAEKAKERGEQRVAARSQIRTIGAKSGVIGKIITRFVGDNQQLLRKDAGLKVALEDPKKFAEMVKKIRKMLARQLQRRGYEASQIQSLLESVEPALTLLREQRL